MASNGVIHIVKDVMMPPAGNIVEVLSNDGNYSTLVAAAQAAGLVEALQGKIIRYHVVEERTDY